ncbi:MAG: glycoside hydrolase family 38 C-terminal domain-containing protein, partial [Acidobacteriota bacterium]
KGSVRAIEKGSVRTITEAVFAYKKSRIVFHTIAYSSWSALEFRLRVQWNEERVMLKLAVPTVFRPGTLICEVPGGAIERPADGEEHVFGRWALIEGEIKGKRTALAVACSGPHGLDFKAGELRLSVLRSAAYCHERGFKLGKYPTRKYMDQGVHDVRFLVTAGDAQDVRSRITALADWLNSPPYALAHLPLGKFGRGEEQGKKRGAEQPEEGSVEQEAQEKKQQNTSGLFIGFANRAGSVEVLSLSPSSIRLSACKRSLDGRALIVRLHETSGRASTANLVFKIPAISMPLQFSPYEIKAVRLERSGAFREVNLISET